MYTVEKKGKNSYFYEKLDFLKLIKICLKDELNKHSITE